MTNQQDTALLPVEQAARAIWEQVRAFNPDDPGATWEGLDDVSRQTFRAYARAALQSEQPKPSAAAREQADRDVMHLAHILEEWDMKDPPNEWTGHSYEDIARDALTRLDRADAEAKPSGERQEGSMVLIEVERNAEGEVMICTGCGTVETVRSIRARTATAFTCCPERKMVRAADLGDHGAEQAKPSASCEAGEVERVAIALCQNALGGKRCPCAEFGKFECSNEHPGHQARAAIAALSERGAVGEEVERLREALEAIGKYGRDNPGHGYSCSRMALAALASGAGDEG